MKNFFILIAILFFTTISIQAQLGGFIKKAKDKVTEKKNTEPIPTQSAVHSSAAENNEQQPVQTKTKDETTRYREYDGQYGYRGGVNGETLADYKRMEKHFSPYHLMRRMDEKGSFHFAKDYPELASITDPVNNDLKIEFSSTPFKGGGEKLSTTFSSSDHLYIKLTATKGTLKDALKITDNDDGINLSFEIFDDENETWRQLSQVAALNKYVLTPAQANSPSVTFDILPDLTNFSQGRQCDFWDAMFAANHDQYVFPRNGNFKVVVEVLNAMVDDWGKPIYGKNISYQNSFDYNFSAKDAAAIVANKDKIWTLRKDAEANAIIPLPKQWTEKTAALAMGYTQAQLISMFENSFNTRLDPHTVVKFHASPSAGGWTVVNNDYGIPIYRYSNQWYTVFVKFVNGKSCFFQGFGLRQQYNGGGTYGKVFCDINPYHMTDCEKMK